MKLTVIIPVYNRSKMLAQALRSLCWQTFQEFQILVMDDASQDNLQAVVDDFPNLNINYHRYDQTLGQVLNSMRGASICKTEYMKFLQSDDLLFPNALELLINTLEESPESGICLGGYIEFEELADLRKIKYHKTFTPFIPNDRNQKQWADLENATCFFPSACMYRTSIFNKIGGFNTQVIGVADWELYVSLSAKYPVVSTPKPICAMRLHPEQITKKFYLNSEYLQIKDVLFITSKSNPYRARLNLPLTQQIYIRHHIFWRILRMGIVSDGFSLKLLAKWLRISISSRMLIYLLLGFPLFSVVFSLRKIKTNPKLDSLQESNSDFYLFNDMLQKLLFTQEFN